ncbi:CBS domain-containing protein [Sphingomonas sp.]|uniref:CBS domain-containing protein n=1 Tax=Sphingomonas sp. TaxID=28214 RepID=UPI00286D538D|nr:CBS domain-containing protein [Sphingomonas sp.]
MTIAAILSTKGGDVATVDSAVRLAQAVAQLADKRIGALVVTQGGAVVGIFSERDLVTCLGKRGAAALDEPVSAAMSAPAISAEPTTPVLTALALMTQKRFRHLPVMTGGQLVGIVSIGDLVKYRIDSIEHEAAAMRSYIQSA